MKILPRRIEKNCLIRNLLMEMQMRGFQTLPGKRLTTLTSIPERGRTKIGIVSKRAETRPCCSLPGDIGEGVNKLWITSKLRITECFGNVGMPTRCRSILKKQTFRKIQFGTKTQNFLLSLKFWHILCCPVNNFF
jgi:hypothetical protein